MPLERERGILAWVIFLLELQVASYVLRVMRDRGLTEELGTLNLKPAKNLTSKRLTIRNPQSAIHLPRYSLNNSPFNSSNMANALWYSSCRPMSNQNASVG